MERDEHQYAGQRVSRRHALRTVGGAAVGLVAVAALAPPAAAAPLQATPSSIRRPRTCTGTDRFSMLVEPSSTWAIGQDSGRTCSI